MALKIIISSHPHSVAGNAAHVDNPFGTAAHPDKFQTDFALVKDGTDGILGPLPSSF